MASVINFTEHFVRRHNTFTLSQIELETGRFVDELELLPGVTIERGCGDLQRYITVTVPSSPDQRNIAAEALYKATVDFKELAIAQPVEVRTETGGRLTFFFEVTR